MKKFLGIVLVLALLLPVLAGCQSAAQSAGTPPSDNPTPTVDPLASMLSQDAVLAIAFADAKVTREEVQELKIELDWTGDSAHYDVDFEKDDLDFDYEIHAETGNILKKEIPAESQPPAAEATKITGEEALKVALEDAGLSKDQIHDLDIELDNDGGALHYDVDFEVNDKDYDYEIDAETGKILNKQTPKKETAATSSSSSSGASPSSKQISRTEARDIALKHAGLTTSQVRDLEVELDKEGGKTYYDVDFEADGYDYDYEVDAESGKILKSRKEKD